MEGKHQLEALCNLDWLSLILLTARKKGQEGIWVALHSARTGMALVEASRRSEHTEHLSDLIVLSKRTFFIKLPNFTVWKQLQCIGKNLV